MKNLLIPFLALLMCAEASANDLKRQYAEQEKQHQLEEIRCKNFISLVHEKGGLFDGGGSVMWLVYQGDVWRGSTNWDLNIYNGPCKFKHQGSLSKQICENQVRGGTPFEACDQYYIEEGRLFQYFRLVNKETGDVVVHKYDLSAELIPPRK